MLVGVLLCLWVFDDLEFLKLAGEEKIQKTQRPPFVLQSSLQSSIYTSIGELLANQRFSQVGYYWALTQRSGAGGERSLHLEN